MEKRTDGLTELNTNEASSNLSYPEVDNSNMNVDKNSFESQKMAIANKVHNNMGNGPVQPRNRFNVLRLFKPGEILNSFIDQ